MLCKNAVRITVATPFLFSIAATLSTRPIVPFYQTIYPMKVSSVGALLLVLCLVQSCVGIDSNDYNESDAIAAFFAQNPNAPVIGDAVKTITNATIFDPLTIEIGTQPAGATGVVINGPKLKNDAAWYRVDFVSGVDGLVLLDDIQLEDGIDGDDINDDPTDGFTLGWLGCSMTRDLGNGMAANGTHSSWQNTDQNGAKVLKSYSGGGLPVWGQPDVNGHTIKWNAFDRGLANWQNTNLIFWQVCTKQEDITATPEVRLDQLEHIATQLATKAPGIPVFIINQPDYDGIVCSITGPEGVAYSQSLVDLALEQGLALEATGLTLGPLGPEDVKDSCHANQTGQDVQVQQLLTWLESL